MLRVLHGYQSVFGAHTLPNPSVAYVFLAEWGLSDRLRFKLEHPKYGMLFRSPEQVEPF